jgi:hypothetical protein
MYLSEDGLYVYTDLNLEPGEYEYKFSEDNVWKSCPTCPTNKNTNHSITIARELDVEYTSNLTYVR